MKKKLTEADFLEVISQLFGEELTEEEIKQKAKETYQHYLTGPSREEVKAQSGKQSSER